MGVFMDIQPYQAGQLGSFGTARYMLLAQHQFPVWPKGVVDKRDEYVSADHDRCLSWDYEHANAAFKRHTNTGELGFSGWVGKSHPEAILAFLVDILKVGGRCNWTGYRVLGTVNRSNGCPVWTLELFGKHPESSTRVENQPSFPIDRRVRTLRWE